jgi:hypothetical protein
VDNLKMVQTPLVGFTEDTLYFEGVIEMMVEFGQYPNLASTMVDFFVINTPSLIMLFWGEKL